MSVRLRCVVLFAVMAAPAAFAGTYEVTLPDCYEAALADNAEIQRLRKEVERAAGTRLVFVSRALPRVSASARGGHRQGSQYDPDGPYSVMQARFSQPVVDVGVPASLRRGRLEVLAAQQNLNLAVINQLHEVRLTYLRALWARGLIELYEQIEKRLQANVESQQQRLEVGTVGRAAVMQAQIQVLNLQTSLAGFRREYDNAVTRLAELMGRALIESGREGELRLPAPVGALQYEPAQVDLVRETELALAKRADLLLLRTLVEAATADRRIVQAGFFPFISLTASGLLIPENVLLTRETEVVPGQETRASEYRLGGALSWRVVDNGEVTGASRRAESVRQAYEISLRALEENIPREVAAAARKLESAEARLGALRASVAQAEENLKLVEAKIGLGEATQLDFLNEQRNLLAVRAGVLNAIYEQETARAELDRIGGRYLEFAGDADR